MAKSKQSAHLDALLNQARELLGRGDIEAAEAAYVELKAQALGLRQKDGFAYLAEIYEFFGEYYAAEKRFSIYEAATYFRDYYRNLSRN